MPLLAALPKNYILLRLLVIASGQKIRAALLQVLKDARRAHATADAHRHHAVASVAALEFAEDACGQLGAGASQRMPQRDGSAVDVDALRIQLSFRSEEHTS